MTVTFVSNYINHHQIPFSNACYQELGEGYHFIQTEPMEEERIAMGWDAEGDKLPYVFCMYDEEEKCRKLIMESDITIFGWTKREDVVKERLLTGKPTIRVSERLYREGQWKAVSPRGLIQKYKDHTKYRNSQVYLLCAGAYVASDFHIVKAYPNKMFRFGYFPETITYKEGELAQLKKGIETIHIVWAGRFMPLKHPEFPVRFAQEWVAQEWVAHEWVNSGKRIHFHMVGDGELHDEMIQMVREKSLTEIFTFYGYRSPEQVREIMEKSHIHLFTSNYLEGWGAVVNEAMNSGCAVIANVQAGSVPYLIKHEENGLIYDGTYEDFALQLKKLIDNKTMIQKLGRAAYETIVTTWNAEHAAKELLRFCKDLQAGKAIPAAEGPLSMAPVIAPSKMYKKIVKHEL